MGEAKARKIATEKRRLTRKLPENLELLHGGETNYRRISIAAIEADPVLMDHVILIEAVMDQIHYFALLPPRDLDHGTIQLLATRVFNDLAAAHGQLLQGYYQIAAALLRDVMEVAFLLGLLMHKPDQIEVWRESDHKQRQQLFGPGKVRDYLNSFPGFTQKKRDAAYRMFCEYAAHATSEGFALMGPTGGKPTIGPFFDLPLLKAVLEEMAQLAAQAGLNAGTWFKTGSDVEAFTSKLRFIEATGEWLERYFGKHQDRQVLAEMKARLAEIGKD